MISRRDKLLIRPWEQRRYEYHRRQVQSALPAIDVGPPKHRVHVSYKLKKHQTEIERCNKIEKDNLKLLQRLRSCMSTSRVDNFWATSQPNFLNRVKIYKTDNKSLTKTDDVKTTQVYENTRRGRCSACTPKKIQTAKIPEERVPWAPPKPAVGRQRSQSLPPQKYKNMENKDKIKSRQNSLVRNDQNSRVASSHSSQKPKLKQRSASSKSLVPIKNKNKKLEDKMEKSFKERSIVLSRDDIKLAVSFPSDTMVKIKDGYKEKVLIDGICHCKAIKT